MASLGETLGADQRGELLDRLEVHPVLTAHPTEARRRAVTEALRRIGAQLDALDSAQLGAAAHAEAVRRLREEIDLLWRTSALRSQAMQPLDEVRSGAAVFDETLFRLAPSVYRALDRALQGDASGSVAPQAPAFLGSAAGSAPTAMATRSSQPRSPTQTARIHAEHALRALENATTRIGRSLTLDAGLLGGSGGGALATGRRRTERGARRGGAPHPVIVGELSSRSPSEPFRTYLLFTAQRLQATRLALSRRTGPASRASAYASGRRLHRRPAARPARAGGGRRRPARLTASSST